MHITIPQLTPLWAVDTVAEPLEVLYVIGWEYRPDHKSYEPVCAPLGPDRARLPLGVTSRTTLTKDGSRCYGYMGAILFTSREEAAEWIDHENNRN